MEHKYQETVILKKIQNKPGVAMLILGKIKFDKECY